MQKKEKQKSIALVLLHFCHLNCKLSHSYGAFSHFEAKKKRFICLCNFFFFFLRFTFLSITVFNGPYLRFTEQTWTVNITCRLTSAVLGKCAFYTLRNMKQGKLSVRGQLACFGVFNYCNL